MIWSEANSHCEGLTAEGKSDWYLPTKDELVTMYNNKSSLQGNADFTAFASGFYWSSTLYERGYPWCVSLSNGGSGTNYKIDRYSVRCVRTK